MGHARLRRTSPIAQYAVGAAVEALGTDAPTGAGLLRIGIVLCVMSGCVQYSRRFYDETLKDPATASPLVFPETVFNAPASHIGAFLGSTTINYTLVGDPGTFLQGIALASDWLIQDEVDGCLVVGAEELDWLTMEAYRLFSRSVVVSEGAGALYLKREKPKGRAVAVRAITEPHLFLDAHTRLQAARNVRREFPDANGDWLLCDGRQGIAALDREEEAVWRDWRGTRVSPKMLLGEGSMASAALQCVVAVDALRLGGRQEAIVNVMGSNQQAIGARFSCLAEGASS
jgi:hypothetical protein